MGAILASSLESRTTDSEERVQAARHWALSLATKKKPQQRKLEDLRLLLPPLPPLQEYVPSSSSVTEPLESYSLSTTTDGPVFSVRAPVISKVAPLTGRASPSSAMQHDLDMLSSRSDVSANHEEERRRDLPCFSKLGSNPNGPPQAIHTMTSEVAAAAVASRQAERSERRHYLRHGGGSGEASRRPAEQPSQGTPPSSRGPPPAVSRHKTVVRPPGRPVVRGTDPLAGSLFSRDTSLDEGAEMRGIYEAQLRKRAPMTAR